MNLHIVSPEMASKMSMAFQRKNISNTLIIIPKQNMNKIQILDTQNSGAIEKILKRYKASLVE